MATKTAPKPKAGTGPAKSLKTLNPNAPDLVPLDEKGRHDLCAQLALNDTRRARLRSQPTDADKGKEAIAEQQRQYDYENFGLTPRPRGATETYQQRTQAQAVEVKNDQNVPVATIERTSKTTHLIFGHSHTKFFVWAGREGWTPAEVQTALKALNIPEISVLSIRTFLYAGRAEAREKGSGKRGEVVEYTKEQAEALGKAAGRIVTPAPEPTPAPKKGRKGK